MVELHPVPGALFPSPASITSHGQELGTCRSWGQRPAGQCCFKTLQQAAATRRLD